MTKTPYKYFNRDISWLSFNNRVLMESKDESLPIYERIKFLSIYSSNLEEYYKVRVSGYHSSILKNLNNSDTLKETLETLRKINEEVSKQEIEYYDIFNNMILPELEKQNIILYHTHKVNTIHESFIQKYFNEEVFPFLQPMIIQKGQIHSFIRDNTIYFAITLKRKRNKSKVNTSDDYTYALMKIPQNQIPRFINLPKIGDKHYIMFIDDVIRANLDSIFLGYHVIDCHSIKISRDADFTINEVNQKNIAEKILNKVRKRKIGAITRFQYDKDIQKKFLDFLIETYEIEREELLAGYKYLNLADLITLPNPIGDRLKRNEPKPLKVPEFEGNASILSVLRKQDVLLHFPYQSFDYLLRFLLQAAFDPKVLEIKITQYRVAENSAVINSLISAAQNGKKVTVFVELKARFDEENNYLTSELMQQAGVKIIYSLPGLKVHAKTAFVRKRSNDPEVPIKGYAYLGTGNFNEKTARIYSDIGLLTSNNNILVEINEVFNILEGKGQSVKFRNILVAQFNMVDEITNMINREINHSINGRKGKIIIKLNSLEDKGMIDALYRASEAGVDIELIIRGICCLIPNQEYSKNIKITRIVDSYLEHTRIWYFHNEGNSNLYITSADWMSRNLYRRIEVAVPILDSKLKKEIIDILNIQLADNTSAVTIDSKLRNIPKTNDLTKVRAQRDTYRYLKEIKSV